MSIVQNDVNYFPKTVGRELLHLFKASQFGLVYTLNVMLIFFAFGALSSLVLINSGDFFINIFNFFIKKFSVPNGEYHGSYSLTNFFWLAYLALIFIIYLVEGEWTKRYGKNLIVRTKYKILAIPIIVCSSYALIIYFFSLNDGFWSSETLFFSILAITTVIANYYYLLISHIVKFLDTKLV